MKSHKVFMILMLVACMAAQPILAGSATAARLIPSESSSLIIDGQEMTSIKSEMVLPEGKLITCRGSCLVQARNMQFVPQDQSIFALSETSEHYELTVRSGRVDFAVGRDSKGLTFHVPNQTIQSEKTPLSATESGVVRGYVTVTDQGAEIVVQEGALQVATADGARMVEPNQPLVMTKDENGRTVLAGSSAAGLAAGGAGLAGSSGGGASVAAASAGGAAAAIVGGAAAAGVAAGVAAGSEDGGRKAVSLTDINPSDLHTKPF